MATHYRPDIDGLRTVAVVPVVLFHLGVSGVGGGFVGVDVFFVISGYLITRVLLDDLQNGPPTFRAYLFNFYERRVRRIFPALFAMIAITTLAFSAAMMPRDFARLGRSVIAAVLSQSNVLFYLESSYFDTLSEFKPLLHTWSLAVEDQFYIAFPLLLYIAYRQSRRRLLATLAIVALASFAWSAFAVYSAPSATFYLPGTRAWELLLGSLLAAGAVPAIRRNGAREAVALAGAALIAWGVFALSKADPFPGLNALPPCLGAALIIWSGAGGSTIVGRLLSMAPMRGIGLISYSLYLWHWPVLVFVRYVSLGEPSSADMLLAAAASVALAYLSWHFVERPFRRPSGHSSRRVVFGSALACMAVLMLMGGIGWATKGLPQRLPEDVRALSAAALDVNPRRDECLPDPSVPAADRVCAIGDRSPGPPIFALIGDSFADAIMPAIESVAVAERQRGIALMRSGCYALLEIRQGNPACTTFMRDAVRTIRSTPSISLVIVTSRWTAAAESTRAGSYTWTMFITDAESPSPSLAESRLVFVRGLDRLLAALAGREIVIVYGAPEQPALVPEAAGKFALFGWQFDASLPRAEYDRRNQFVREALDRASADRGVSLFDLGLRLCNSAECPAVVDGIPLYSDDNHLSTAGARYVAENLRQIFARAGAQVAGQSPPITPQATTPSPQ